MQKNYSKYTTLYRAVMAIITIIAYVLLSIRTVQAGFRFEDGALLYQFEGIGMLFYATLMIPAMLLGLKLSSLAFQAPNWRAKIRSLTVGLTILALAASIFYQYVYDFFFNNQLTGALDESVTYVFLAFLAVNIAVLIIDASHKKTDK